MTRPAIQLIQISVRTSSATRLFLRRVVIDRAFPLKLNVPAMQKRVAMDESHAMMANCRACFATINPLFADLEKNNGQ